LPSRAHRQTRSGLGVLRRAESRAGTIVRAAAVEVCEPRQGREAAAL